MKEITYYKALECFENGGCMALSKKTSDGWTWKLDALEEAQQLIQKAIDGRKKQMFYWRNYKNEIVDKISYYERYRLEYKVYKVIEQKELLYTCDNSDIELRDPSKETKAQEFTTI